MNNYPKRLIEVDLPIKRISAHARREKDMRRGHIPLIHIYPAARPVAACRAITCASLWFDPVDKSCPDDFRIFARQVMRRWGADKRSLMSEESFHRFELANKSADGYDDDDTIRMMLLDFLADFSSWENSIDPSYLAASRELTEAAHHANGGVRGTRPLVVDPFAGGGAIPLEALRIGADAFASDLNPVALLIEKVVTEYVPQYGEELISEIRTQLSLMRAVVADKMQSVYPPSEKGETPLAYIWTRTIECEGPACGASVPLLRSGLLRKKAPRVSLVLEPSIHDRSIKCLVKTLQPGEKSPQGTIKRGSVICPVCGYTTNVTSVRAQLRRRKGGTRDARLMAVVTTRKGARGRLYRGPVDQDFQGLAEANEALDNLSKFEGDRAFPDESTEHYHSFVNRGPIYGMTNWGDYFTARQLVTNAAFANYVRNLRSLSKSSLTSKAGFLNAVKTVLALTVDKMIDMNCSLCVWQSHAEIPAHVFGRWAIPMVFDFAETNPLAKSSGSPESAGKRTCDGLSTLLAGQYNVGQVMQASATRHPLPNDSAQCVITDPPYYYSVQYADLMDFFYVWLRRMCIDFEPTMFSPPLIEKSEEIIVQSPGDATAVTGKNNDFFEEGMRLAMREARRIIEPKGIIVVVFAHTSTAGWESQLQAMVNAGWTVTASWPIDTEMASRVIAQGRSVLGSSVHLVCRPREEELVGDWRDVLRALPVRIHEWMPRLASEGVVGADAIFACLGPALEIFSRYSSVEKPSGETVTLREYLEHVWAAVAKEALNMIFVGADATGFEEDARLTAMWLWTLFSGISTTENGEDTEEDEGEEQENGSVKKKASGYMLEYDAARKIAQGLGASLEALDSIIEVKGDKARLLPVNERARELFGFESSSVTEGKKKKKSKTQGNLFTEMEDDEHESAFGVGGVPTAGATTLDKVHQAMLLFGAGRGEAVKRFLVDDGVGNDERFWRLANALSALYPSGSQEKRWVDGVLARKKGLGF